MVTTKALQKWNKTHFGSVHHKIKDLEERLSNLQSGLHSDESNQKRVLEDLRIQRARLESIYKQKSQKVRFKKVIEIPISFIQACWLEGENKIIRIQDGMEWIQGKHQIKEYFLREFKDLFTYDNPSIHNELEHLVEKKIFMEDNIAMMAVPLEEEIKDCV